MKITHDIDKLEKSSQAISENMVDKLANKIFDKLSHSLISTSKKAHPQEIKNEFISFIKEAFTHKTKENIYNFLTLDIPNQESLIKGLENKENNDYFDDNFLNQHEYIIYKINKSLSINYEYKPIINPYEGKVRLTDFIVFNSKEKRKNDFAKILMDFFQIPSNNLQLLNEFIICYTRAKLFFLYSKELYKNNLKPFQENDNLNLPIPNNKTPLESIPFLINISYESNGKPIKHIHNHWYMNYENFYSLIEESIIKPINTQKILTNRINQPSVNNKLSP